MGLFSKKPNEVNTKKAIATYTVFYQGGLPEYPKKKIDGIKLNILEDSFELEPTISSKKWFQPMKLQYDKVTNVSIENRAVSTGETILSIIGTNQLNSTMLSQKNNIHISFMSTDRQSLTLRLEMLSGVTVMGQAAKCEEFKDRITTSGIIDKFAKVANSHENKTDDIDILEKYAELHKKGIITDKEFEAKKRQILGL